MLSTVRITLSLLLVLTVTTLSAQSLWKESADNHQQYFAARSNVARPTVYRLMDVDATKLRQLQATVPEAMENTIIAGTSIEFPMPDGGLHNTTMVQTSIWQNKATSDALDVKTYELINPKNGAFEGNISVMKDGISGVLFSEKGLVYINPLNVDNSGAHIIHYLKDAELADIRCLANDVNQYTNTPLLSNRTTAGDCRARVYRLAVAATYLYTNWAGGVTQARNYITITMNTVNAIYKRDVNVTFSLVENTSIIYTDAGSDSYGSTGGLSSAQLNTNQTNIDGAIGSGNYDVGIVFNRGWSGGLAQLNSVCSGSKARGAVGFASGTGANPIAGPQGQWFDGATAHELGHMFGATHTFSANNGSCAGNATLGSAWEPGSGSTLMAYAAAGCGPTNAIQTYQDYYFHAGNIAQMQSFITGSATCATPVTTANVAPSASTTAASYNIPANTPFMLTINATDANSGDALTYSWEQMNAATVQSATAPSSTNTSGPMFRSRPATSSPTRYFPALTYLINQTGYEYEVLPSVPRTLNFRGTVRDNSTLGGCTSEVNVTLNVQTSTGFKVTTPAWGTVWNKSGNNTALVQWDVAGTNAAPINASSVDILLSTDGGNTYPITLAGAVPNTGSYNVPIPALNTTTGKVMVRGTGNVFFNIQDEMLIITDPLPVTFLSFTARKEGSYAVLNWSTANESNSDKFIVERAVNASDFRTQLGTVKAAGNSTTTRNYTFTDAAPLNKWNYYRLQQVDLDGKITYSTIVSVYFNKDGKSIISAYPNPVKDRTTLDFYAAAAGKVNLDVYDSKGALVATQQYIAVPGFNRTSVNLQSLATGIYTLKCYTNTELIGVTKLIKE